MVATPRPLPKIPPPYLTSVQPADVRSYRPLPPPPLLWADCNSISSTESGSLWTPPLQDDTCGSGSSLSSFASLSSASSKPLSKPRPNLQIDVTSPTIRQKTSLDSLTVRSPALYDPSQMLSPVAGFRLVRPKYAPHTSKRANRVTAVDSGVLRPWAFTGPAPRIESNTRESGGDEPAPVLRIPQPEYGISDRVPPPRPPRSRPPPILIDRTGTNHPGTAIRVSTGMISNCDSDNEIGGPNLRPADLTNGCESGTRNTKNRKPFTNITKVAIKSHLFRPRTRSTKSSGAPAVDAKRISQIPSPLDQTWYKEQGGWRWVEGNVGDVRDKLRKLR